MPPAGQSEQWAGYTLPRQSHGIAANGYHNIGSGQPLMANTASGISPAGRSVGPGQLRRHWLGQKAVSLAGQASPPHYTHS